MSHESAGPIAVQIAVGIVSTAREKPESPGT